jgi:hypothetical protein
MSSFDMTSSARLQCYFSRSSSGSFVFVAVIGRRSVAGFTDDRYPFVLCKERTVAFANDGVVVDNKDAGCLPAHCTSFADTSNGIIAWSLKPYPRDR